ASQELSPVLVANTDDEPARSDGCADMEHRDDFDPIDPEIIREPRWVKETVAPRPTRQGVDHSHPCVLMLSDASQLSGDRALKRGGISRVRGRRTYPSADCCSHRPPRSWFERQAT